MTQKMTQTQAVLDRLSSGRGITSMEAFNELGVTRLSAIIFSLRKKGYRIESETVESTNRCGEVVRFSRYSMVDDML